MKKLIIFDVDNTIVKGQSQQLLLSYLYKTKKISLFYYLVVLAWFTAYRLHITKDPRSIVSYAYSFLNRKSVNEIDVLMSDFFNEVLIFKIFPEVFRMIQNFKKEDNKIIFVSNAPSIIVKPLANYFEAYRFFCTKLEIVNDVYTGKICGDIMYGENKKIVVSSFALENKYDLSSAIAFGDHISDLPVLEIVGHPIVINPSRLLLNIAKQKNWEIHNWSL